jgi:penicillin-binding protein 2
MMALAGLTYNVVDPERREFCNGAFHLPGSTRQYREGKGGKHGAVDLVDAVARSCDVYFYGLAATLGVDRIAAFAKQFGIGSLTGIDISGEKPGLLPTPAWKKRTFKRPEDQIWFPGETVNFGVGQGYLLVTPLQLAHMTAMLAERGRSFQPRVVMGVRDAAGRIIRNAPVTLAGTKGISDASWGWCCLDRRVGLRRLRRQRMRALRLRQDRHRASHRGAKRRYNANTGAERARSFVVPALRLPSPHRCICVLVENGGSCPAARYCPQRRGRLSAGRCSSSLARLDPTKLRLSHDGG